TASITGAYVALLLACRRLQQDGYLKRNPIIQEVAAVSVGIVDGVALLDLNYAEDSAADVDMNIVCTGTGKFIEIQGTAERKAFSGEQMTEMLAVAEKGVQQLMMFQRYALR
ncbi:MAG TPA: ribonuclease PH, partial [Pyrinomonadaceae bacterium]|nr:ribonuclease PH [Pyrinomonadaceae bacterium]